MEKKTIAIFLGIITLASTFTVYEVVNNDNKQINNFKNQKAIIMPNAFASYDGYRQVLSIDELLDGSHISIVRYSNHTTVLSNVKKGNNLSSVSATLDSGKLNIDEDKSLIEVEKSNDKYYFHMGDKVLANENPASQQLTLAVKSDSYTISVSKQTDIGKFSLQSNVSNVGNYKYIGYTSSGDYFSTFESASVGLYVDVLLNLDLWSNQYLLMNDDIENQCKTQYSIAKNKLLKMGDKYISCLIDYDAFTTSQERYEAWARANNDNDPYGQTK